MSTENSPQVWRVVVACDEVQPHTHTREVDVYRNHLGWFTSETTSLGLATSHAAVMEHVHEKRWPVVEIVAPGQPTRAELEARNVELVKERDAAVATEREEGGKLCDLCAQFARVMGDPHAEEYEKLAAAIRAGSRALLPLHVERGASPIDLDAIEARANAATAGPWKADHELGHVYAGEYGDTVVCSRDDNTNGADLDFIAHTREDVDVLRAEVRRLRGALAHLHRGEDR